MLSLAVLIVLGGHHFGATLLCLLLAAVASLIV
jgi:hypothetical protein